MIKSAYKQRMMEYHPDKVNNLGKELQNLAENKTKEINEAYEFLKKSKILDRTHIINAIIIVLIASIVGIFYNLLLPNPLPWKYTEKKL